MGAPIGPIQYLFFSTRRYSFLYDTAHVSLPGLCAVEENVRFFS
jgi:hypothetical protein